MPPAPYCSGPILRWRASTASRRELPESHSPPSLTLEQFRARLDTLGAPKRFAIAVSGGRDSMALMRLCAAHTAASGAEILAFTVDHGLRAAAADEAAQVKRWCADAGLAHETLRWTGTKPSTGLQAAARHARYRLLAQAANAAGCDALLTAHTLDDQAETIFMRLARGAGVDGLAAMRAETLIAAGAGAPIRLLRPMLEFSRAAGTQYLAALGQPYIDDPSNDDPAFERIRVRGLLAALAEQDILNADALCATGRKLDGAAHRLRAQEDKLFNTCGGVFYRWGGASLCRWDDNQPGAVGLARRLIYACGGGEHLPDEDAAARAVSEAAVGRAATLGGALIKRWKDQLWFLREPAGLTGRTGIPAADRVALHEPLLWDNRYILRPQGDTADCEIGALGEAGLSENQQLFQGPPEALAALPGVYQRGVLIGAPTLPFTPPCGVSAEALIEERYRRRIVRFS